MPGGTEWRRRPPCTDAQSRADRWAASVASFVRKDGIRPAPKSKNLAHAGWMEMRAIRSYIDPTRLSNSGTWSAPITFLDAAMYSSGTPSTISTFASRDQERLRLRRGVAGIDRDRDMRARHERIHLGCGRRRADDDLAPIPIEPDRDYSRESIRSVVSEPKQRRRDQQLPSTGLLELLGDLLLVHDLPFPRGGGIVCR